MSLRARRSARLPAALVLLALARAAADSPIPAPSDTLATGKPRAVALSIHALAAPTRIFADRDLVPPSLAELAAGEEVELLKVDWKSCQVRTAGSRVGWAQTNELAWVHWFQDGTKSVERIHGGILGRGKDIFPEIRRARQTGRETARDTARADSLPPPQPR